MPTPSTFVPSLGTIIFTTGGFCLAVAHDLMPNRTRYAKLQVLKIDIAPAKCKQFADSKSGCRVEKSERALPDGQLTEEQLEFPNDQIKSVAVEEWLDSIKRAKGTRAKRAIN